jgi:Amt family ammonium transporter
MGMATAGALFLFFGWFGFNGGSTLAYSTKVDDIVFATVIAGFAAGLSATAVALIGERYRWKQRGYVIEKALGGFLGGLVAITASCDLVTEWWQPAIIGVTAGIVHNLVFDLLLRLEIDDPVGAIPVHLGCGIWGTACVAVLTQHFLAQAVGIVAAFGWTFGTASLVFGLLLILKRLNLGEWLFLSDFEKRLLVRRQM